MNNARIAVNWIIAILGLVIVILAFGWGNYRFVLQNPGGYDFLPRWVGTRLYLLQGQSPYSPETTLAIDEAHQTYDFTPWRFDQSYYTYPLYIIFVAAPFSLIEDFLTARAAWAVASLLGILLIIWFSFLLHRWRPSTFVFLLVLAFSVGWYYSVRVLISGSDIFVVGVLVTAALLAVRAEQDVLAGFLLAASTIKPQAVAILLAFVLIWAISQQRWKLFWSLAGSLALILAGTSLLQPNWIVENVQQIMSPRELNFTIPDTPGGLLYNWLPGVGRQAGTALSAITIGMLIIEWRAAWGKDFNWFVWTAWFTLAASSLIGIVTSLDHIVLLLPALILILATWNERWGILGRWLVVLSLLLLFLGIWAEVLASAERGAAPDSNVLLFFLMPLFTIIGLYWVRWWAIHPPLLPLEKFTKMMR